MKTLQNIIALTLTVLALQAPAGAATWYLDQDADGYGDASNSMVAGTQPPGYVDNALDCHDQDALTHPGAVETCGGNVDLNCDGWIGSGCTVWFGDTDFDGWGDCGDVYQGTSPPPGYVADCLDCDDNNANIYPGGPEICGDQIDNNCDGVVDNTCSAVDRQATSWSRVKSSYR